MKLKKRNCDMQIRLTPCDCDILQVHWRIDGKNYHFIASGAMGSQFSAFLSAVYGLYEEEDQSHYLHCKYYDNFSHEYPYNRKDNKHCFKARVTWNGEGPIYTITFTRICENEGPIIDLHIPDTIQVKIESNGCLLNECTVDGRDLCYAVAKGCTDTLKKYGFKGYTKTSGGYDVGDSFNIEELLFVKAYALEALDICNSEELWKNPNSRRKIKVTNFEEEMKLFVFDM